MAPTHLHGCCVFRAKFGDDRRRHDDGEVQVRDRLEAGNFAAVAVVSSHLKVEHYPEIFRPGTTIFFTFQFCRSNRFCSEPSFYSFCGATEGISAS
jgi:hypothetical protein